MEGPSNEKKKALIFTVTEVTHNDGTLYLYGREDVSGYSVCAKNRSFYHYFYVLGTEVPSDLEQLARQSLTKEVVQVIHSMKQVEKTSILTYQEPSKMIKITVCKPWFVGTCRQVLEHRGYVTFEASINFEMRYMVDKGFGGNDWIRIDKTWATGKETHCDVEIEFHNLEKLSNYDALGRQRIMSFDIEACKGGLGRGFVNPSDPNDFVSQIGWTLYESDYTILDKRVFSMGDSIGKIPNLNVQCFQSEAKLLLAFSTYIIEKDPDIFTGYNIDGFDWWYLFERAKVLGILKSFATFAKRPDSPVRLKKAFFQSAAKGARSDYQLICDGRFCFDMFKYIKDTKKFRSYELGAVSKELLGDAKVEMPYDNIPIYQAGTDEQRAHLAYYCWYDADLCRKLMKSQMTIVNNIETARVCGVPMKYLITRGQQVLTMSLLLRYGNPRGFVVPSSTDSQNDEDTQGATVLEPLRGFYDCWIIVLDFQSLYPSIIRDRNICYSTKMPLRLAQKKLKPSDYYIPKVSNANYVYVKPHIRRGILPEMEETLFFKRLAAKADLKKETDPQKKDVLNGRQLAIKVRMNSIYGFLKANMVCDKDLMESVTGEGRYMIEQSKELVESTFPGSQVVYGDSVTGDTPCLVKDLQNGRFLLLPIELLATSEFQSNGEKQYAQSNRFLIWTETGWTGIRRLIRHQVKKPLIRVTTHLGIVDCTTDHGLVLKNGIRISPNDLNAGDELLHSFPTSMDWPNMNTNISLDEADRLGRTHFGLGVPVLILNSPRHIRSAFLRGYSKGNVFNPFYAKKKEHAAECFALLKSLGFSCCVQGTYQIHVVNEEGEFAQAVQKVEYLPMPKNGTFVYDLETENHHFHAGVGQMIVHNTDSIFVKYGDTATEEEAFRLGAESAKLCTDLFTKDKPVAVHVLQREKGFNPFLLIGKKKYVGHKQMGPGETPFLDSSGIETVRRDNALIVPNAMETCLNQIIVKRNIPAAIQHVHSVLSDLLMGRIEISQLIISKALSKSFEHYEKSGVMLPHVELAKKIKARMHLTGEKKPATGDRIKFVMVSGLKGSKNSECAEDPLFVLNNRLTINYNYYISNQLLKPLLRIFTPILAPNESMKKKNRKGDSVYLNDEEICKLTAYKSLFVGPHMNKRIVRVKEGGQGIMKFAKKRPSCISCGCSSTPDQPLCPTCKPSETLVYLKMIEQSKELENKRWQAWTRCQMCIGDKHVHKISCANKNCDNFYQREKLVMDIEDLADKLKHF